LGQWTSVGPPKWTNSKPAPTLIALIEDPQVIRRILNRLGLPTGVPATRPARSPPLPVTSSDPWYDDVVVP
jgi:hypothetical protein